MVLAVSAHVQVGWIVVGAIPVDVMHYLGGTKTTPECALRDEDVFFSPRALAGHRFHQHIPARIHVLGPQRETLAFCLPRPALACGNRLAMCLRLFQDSQVVPSDKAANHPEMSAPRDGSSASAMAMFHV